MFLNRAAARSSSVVVQFESSLPPIARPAEEIPINTSLRLLTTHADTAFLDREKPIGFPVLYVVLNSVVSNTAS